MSAKYDDASWHVDGDFPEDLNPDAASTHIGFFLGWCIENNLHGELLKEHFESEISSFLKSKISGPELLRKCCDGKLISDDLSEKGNAFAMEYYETNRYYEDYDEIVGEDLPSLYHVDDSWANYEKVKAFLDKRYSHWLRARQDT